MTRREIIALMAASLYQRPYRFPGESLSQARLKARKKAVRLAKLLYAEVNK
jgi:hypothetical protein